jgi:2,4-dienoyl-CoA reductase-like NADH-dependent reductase (Old Yellow Enzyme family)
MSRLFEPLAIGPLRLENRIVIAPMCQYSAEGGSAGDWHLIHLGHLALSGAGLMILEATAVSPEGRISPWDLGLYSDDNEAALARVLAAVRAHSPMPIAVQLAHAGRKGSSRAPWDGGAQIRPGELAAGGPRHPRRSRTRPGRTRRRRSTAPGWRASATASRRRPGAPPGSASTGSRSTPPTATCCTSSSPDRQ